MCTHPAAAAATAAPTKSAKEKVNYKKHQKKDNINNDDNYSSIYRQLITKCTICYSPAWCNIPRTYVRSSARQPQRRRITSAYEHKRHRCKHKTKRTTNKFTERGETVQPLKRSYNATQPRSNGNGGGNARPSHILLRPHWYAPSPPRPPPPNGE